MSMLALVKALGIKGKVILWHWGVSPTPRCFRGLGASLFFLGFPKHAFKIGICKSSSHLGHLSISYLSSFLSIYRGLPVRLGNPSLSQLGVVACGDLSWVFPKCYRRLELYFLVLWTAQFSLRGAYLPFWLRNIWHEELCPPFCRTEVVEEALGWASGRRGVPFVSLHSSTHLPPEGQAPVTGSKPVVDGPSIT